jgi:hypothetical protein
MNPYIYLGIGNTSCPQVHPAPLFAALTQRAYNKSSHSEVIGRMGGSKRSAVGTIIGNEPYLVSQKRVHTRTQPAHYVFKDLTANGIGNAYVKDIETGPPPTFPFEVHQDENQQEQVQRGPYDRLADKQENMV